MPTIRPIKQVIEPQMVIEGAGVLLRRSIAPQVSNHFDPFLLFDHFAFNDPIEGPIRGFPMHPHRGIETVTYMLAGSVNHRDSLGNAGLIGAGDVQWMSAGGGIMHEEMPRRGPDGSIYGFQLWVNLPAALKMSPPKYQEVKASAISVLEREGCQIKLVAGNVDGVSGPVSGIAIEPVYLEATLEPGASLNLPIPAEHTALAYVFEGNGELGGGPVQSVSLVVLGAGDLVSVRAGLAGMRFMLFAGAPIGEPIAPYGPFVMNTPQEIQQALEDLRNGTFVQ